MNKTRIWIRALLARILIPDLDLGHFGPDFYSWSVPGSVDFWIYGSGSLCRLRHGRTLIVWSLFCRNSDISNGRTQQNHWSKFHLPKNYAWRATLCWEENRDLGWSLRYQIVSIKWFFLQIHYDFNEEGGGIRRPQHVKLMRWGQKKMLATSRM
jgi:hypothetical protein